MKAELTEKLRERAAEVLERAETKRSAMLPLLFEAQKLEGYITRDAVEAVAELTETTPQQVWEVATFYTMFNKKPVGKYHIQVCGNLSCYLRGAFNLITHIENKLGIKLGETTPDGMFTLTRVECLGSCGTAPVMQINEEYYEDLTPEKVDDILEKLKAEAQKGSD